MDLLDAFFWGWLLLSLFGAGAIAYALYCLGAHPRKDDQP
jgi:hypothetical protein